MNREELMQRIQNEPAHMLNRWPLKQILAGEGEEYIEEILKAAKLKKSGIGYRWKNPDLKYAACTLLDDL